MGAPSYLAGALFAVGWWFFVDGWVSFGKEHEGKYKFVMWLPGLLGTFAFLMVNMTKPSELNQTSMFDETNANNVKIWFFFSILVSFASIIAAIWITVASEDLKEQQYSGVTLILQSISLLISSLVFWFGRGLKKDEFSMS
jgi:hypothetical protein|uniref:Transmembrane protein 50A n=1 Tax=Eutreptiella gymnastica TaxID=73025 RepID=A0A7S4FR13_9EUGL